MVLAAPGVDRGAYNVIVKFFDKHLGRRRMMTYSQCPVVTNVSLLPT